VRDGAPWLIAALLAAAVPAPPAGAQELAATEQRVHALVNAHRRSNDAPPLDWNDEIAKLARQHSVAMAQEGTGFGHEGFEERSETLSAAIPLRRVAENVAKQKRSVGQVPDAALARWLQSARHRKNLEGDFDLAGVGVARSADGTYYLTQIFVARRRQP
jgi:uncharacterized protein YkwD